MKPLRKLYEEIKGDLNWTEFEKSIGCSRWALRYLHINHGKSVPVKVFNGIVRLAMENNFHLSKNDKMHILLGDLLCQELNKEPPRLLKGKMTLEEWLISGDWLVAHETKTSRIKKLGLNSSTPYQLKRKHFRHFTPERAVVVVRRSDYEIDFFSLIGVNRALIDKTFIDD